MACPGMGSAEYGAALMANGAPELAEGFEPGWDDKFVAQLPPPEDCAIAGCACARIGCLSGQRKNPQPQCKPLGRNPNRIVAAQLEALRILIAKISASPFWIPALG